MGLTGKSCPPHTRFVHSQFIAVSERGCSQRLRPPCWATLLRISTFLAWAEAFLRPLSREERRNLEDTLLSDLELNAFLRLNLPPSPLPAYSFRKPPEALCSGLRQYSTPVSIHLTLYWCHPRGKWTCGGASAFSPLSCCLYYYSKWLRVWLLLSF